MGRRWTNRTYLKVRKWVDRDLTDWPRRPISLFGPLFVGTGALVAATMSSPIGGWIFWLLIFPLLIAWEVFALWRAARLSRAFSIGGDRQYDREGKYVLPPEYAESESVLAVRRRKRRAGRR